MGKEIKTIPLLKAHSSIPYDSPPPDKATVSEDEDAQTVMTDFTEIVPLTIKPDTTLARALEKMKEHGIRLLMVKDIKGNIGGVITAYDIQSEKPVKYAAESGVQMDDIRADMLMTPVEQTPAFDFNAIQQATVGQIVETMKELDRPHVLVIEVDNGQRIRGIFSSSKVSRLLGRPVYQPLRAAHSITDLQNKIGDH